MWWLAIPAAVGAAAAIWKLVDDDAKEARARWERDRASVQRSVKEHRRNIKKNLERAQQSYDFHFLTDMHFSSVKVADHAYKALGDARTSLDVMGRMLVEAKKKREQAYDDRRATTSREERQRLQEEVDLLNDLRATIFPDKDAVKEQRNSLHDEVKRLNEQTRLLKLAIRDRCGPKGSDWYERLEARTAERRARSRR